MAVDYSMSAAEIEKAAEAAGVEVAQPHPLGMYISVAKYRITLPSDIQKLTDGSICVVPTALQVVFSYVHRTIYIAREIRGDPCLSGAWVAREMASARADDAAMQSFLGAFGDPFRAAVSGIQASLASNSQLSKRAFILAINAVIQEALGQLTAIREHLQGELEASPAIGDPNESCRRNPKPARFPGRTTSTI